MKKDTKPASKPRMRPEYDLAELGPGVQGKYFQKASAGSNVVLIDPDLAAFFPDAQSVNRALRLVADAALALNTRGR